MGIQRTQCGPSTSPGEIGALTALRTAPQ